MVHQRRRGRTQLVPGWSARPDRSTNRSAVHLRGRPIQSHRTRRRRRPRRHAHCRCTPMVHRGPTPTWSRIVTVVVATSERLSLGVGDRQLEALRVPRSHRRGSADDRGEEGMVGHTFEETSVPNLTALGRIHQVTVGRRGARDSRRHRPHRQGSQHPIGHQRTLQPCAGHRYCTDLRVASMGATSATGPLCRPRPAGLCSR